MRSFASKVPSVAHPRLPKTRHLFLRIHLVLERRRTSFLQPHHPQPPLLPHRQPPRCLHRHQWSPARDLMTPAGPLPLRVTRHRPRLLIVHHHPRLFIVCHCPRLLASCPHHVSRLPTPLPRKPREAGRLVTHRRGPLDRNIATTFTRPLPTSSASLVGLSGKSYWQVTSSLRVFRPLDL